MGATYSVSRCTVRAAIETLEEDGLLKRQKRRGALVTSRAIQGRDAKSASKASPSSLLFVQVFPDTSILHMADGARRYCRTKNIEIMVVDADTSHDKVAGYCEHLKTSAK